MTPVLVILGVVLALRFLAGLMTSDEPEPAAPPALPRPPRRAQRRRATAPPPSAPAVSEPAADEVPAVQPARLVQPAASRRTVSRFAFRGRDDVRRAVVLREVLGPPLSLRR